MIYTSEELLVGAILSAALTRGDGRLGFHGSGTELFDVLKKKWPGDYSENQFLSAIRQLKEWGLVNSAAPSGINDLINIDVTYFGWNEYSKIEWRERAPVVYHYTKFRDSWLINEWELSRKSSPTEPAEANGVYTDDAEISVPASDRVVALDHNSAEIKEIISETDLLLVQLKAANDKGRLSDLDVKAAIVEVDDIARNFRAEAIRPHVIFERVRSTLTWIGSKAAEAVIGSLALALLALIASFLGFSI